MLCAPILDRVFFAALPWCPLSVVPNPPRFFWAEGDRALGPSLPLKASSQRPRANLYYDYILLLAKGRPWRRVCRGDESRRGMWGRRVTTLAETRAHGGRDRRCHGRARCLKPPPTTTTTSTLARNGFDLSHLTWQRVVQLVTVLFWRWNVARASRISLIAETLYSPQIPREASTCEHHSRALLSLIFYSKIQLQF